MTARHRFAFVLTLCALACLPPAGPAAARPATPAAAPAAVTAPPPDGQHDFDFNLGAWKTRVRRLQHPLSGSSTWVTYEGTHIVRKVWDGRANLGELELDGPAGQHIEGLALRLYSPRSHQWKVYFANSASGTTGVPLVGGFRHGRGEFIDQDDWNGRTILVRNVWSNITPTSCHSEQSFSADGGKTWEVNWIATDTRLPDGARPHRLPIEPQGPAAAGAPGGGAAAALATERDGQHDFDFDLGTWKIHMRRLRHPLTGSSEWFEMDGITDVQPIWGGRANLATVEGDAPGEPHLEILALRLYNPRTRQWSIRFAGSASGTLSDVPAVGVFADGQGELLDSEPYAEERSIFVRFRIGPKDGSSSCHSEQAFSGDGGKTWETNWINDYEKVR